MQRLCERGTEICILESIKAPSQKRFFSTWSLHSARDLSNEAVTTSLVLPALSNERHRNGWSLRDAEYYNLQ